MLPTLACRGSCLFCYYDKSTIAHWRRISFPTTACNQPTHTDRPTDQPTCVPLVPVVKTRRHSPPIFSRSSFACRSSSSGPFFPPLRLACVCRRVVGYKGCERERVRGQKACRPTPPTNQTRHVFPFTFSRKEMARRTLSGATARVLAASTRIALASSFCMIWLCCCGQCGSQPNQKTNLFSPHPPPPPT